MSLNANATALPHFWELTAEPHWKVIDFISDIHLCASKPKTFEAWAAHMLHTPADVVFLLGDVFELWVGDDAINTPGFEADCAAVLTEACAQRAVGLMVGNRDFLMGRKLLRGCGLIALSDPTILIAFGERALLTHGDLLCTDDQAYQRFRTLVRSAPWQADFLSKSLPERHQLAQQIRAASMASRSTAQTQAGDDIDISSAVQWMHESGSPTLIHGHIHRPRTETLAPGFVRHVLSEWECDAPEVPEALRSPVLRWQRNRFDRMEPAKAPVAVL
jgi:UDP-2,3-diacylglucosamine hydrolase